MKPIFKHQAALAELLSPCPPDEATPKSQKAYRWVSDSIAEEVNFLPVALKKPQRMVEKTDVEKCLFWGLSMYVSLEKARSNFLKITAGWSPNLKSKLGINIAEGDLLLTDGVCETEDHKGHFNFYPFESSTFEARFFIVEKLPL